MPATLEPQFSTEHASDETMAVLAQEPNHNNAMNYLLTKYSSFVRSKITNYYLAGSDSDDIYQEGMFGLYKAIRDFNPQKQITFKSFADICITRQIITAVKAATRNKHYALNHSYSFDLLTDTDDPSLLAKFASWPIIDTCDPALIYEAKITSALFRKLLYRHLSKFEIRVLSHYLCGLTYYEISSILKCSTKSIDNALQRSKRKISSSLDELRLLII